MSLRFSDKKRKSMDSIYIDGNDLSPLQSDSKAKSQRSLLLIGLNNPDPSNQKSSTIDNARAQHNQVSSKQTLTHKYIPKASSNQSKNNKYSSNNDKDKDNYLSPGNLRLIKSASSSDIHKFEDFDDIKVNDDKTPVDIVDGPSETKSATVKWNANQVDIQTTELMLKTLDEYIKEKRDKIFQEESQKVEIVDKLISNFNLKPNDKSSKKMRRDYESQNKSAEKSLEKTKLELEQLEYKRSIVSQEGIPWKVSPSDFVKSINKKDRNKKNIELPIILNKKGQTPLSKGYAQKSVSAENIIDLLNSTAPDTQLKMQWDTDSDNYATSFSRKCRTSEDFKKEFLNTSWSTFKKPDSISNSSAGGEKGNQRKKSTTNSVTSGFGCEFLMANSDTKEAPRHKSFSLSPLDDHAKDNDLSVMRLKALYDDLDVMKKEISEVRTECHRAQFDTDNLKLDLTTNSEVSSQRMQNALERVDRLEQILDNLRGQCQLEFLKWKEDIRKTEEKLEYRLLTTRRDLQDNIDGCFNGISLLEKRTEQMPFLANRSGTSDMKVIGSNFINLLISLAAFIMILASSAIQVLIRGLNMGATVSQNRASLVLAILVTLVVAVVIMKWAIFSSASTETVLSNT